MGCGASANAKPAAQTAASQSLPQVSNEIKWDETNGWIGFTCTQTAATSAEAKAAARKTVAEWLTDGMEVVKNHFQKQMEEPYMISKILEVMRYYQLSTMAYEDGLEIFKCSLMGHILHRDKNYKMNGPFCRALIKLLEPDRLSQVPDVTENMFDFIELTKRTKRVVDEMTAFGDVTDDDDSEEEAAPILGQRFPRFLPRGQTQVLSESSRETNREDMLRFLAPLHELCDNMQANFMDRCGITNEERSEILNLIGHAIFEFQVFDFAKKGKHVKRAAFVGPERVGKSTCLNYITSNGRGEQFMFISPGMGTTIPCIISHASQEKLSLNGKKVLIAGRVHEVMKGQSEKFRKQKLKGINAFRATKSFDPPYEVELIDVPGIKDSTELMSCVTLGRGSAIVLCLGDLNTSRSRLKDPTSLKLLVEITKKFDREINLVCLITRDVLPGEVDTGAYQAMLEEFFPKARQPISVIYANFMKIENMDQRVHVVTSFYRALGHSFTLRSRDPHEIFFNMSTRLDNFLKKVHKGVTELMKPFSETFKQVLISEIKHSIEDEKRTTNDSVKQQLQRKQINAHPRFNISHATQCFPCFSVGINQKHVAQVKDDVLIAQELVFECRLAIIEWLAEVAMMLHNLAFGDHFDCISMAIQKDNDDLENARRIVCDRLCMIAQCRHVEENPEMETREWWDCKYGHRAGQFFTYAAFPWVLIGNYMIRSDGIFTEKPSKDGIDWVKKWNEDLTKVVNRVKPLHKDKPHGRFPKFHQKKSKHQEVFGELFRCIADFSERYEGIVNENGLAHWGDPLENLFEICFTTLQRLIVRKPWDSDLTFTSFANHLRENRSHELGELVSKIADAKEGKPKLCSDVLSVMKQCGVGRMKNWRDKTAALEEDLELMTRLDQDLSTGFLDGSDQVTIIPCRSDSGAISMWCLSGEEVKVVWKPGDVVADIKRELARSTGADVGSVHLILGAETLNDWVVVQADDKITIVKADRSAKEVEETPITAELEKFEETPKEVGAKIAEIPFELQPTAAEDYFDYPENIKQALRRLKANFPVTQPSPVAVDDVVYARAAIHHIRKSGSKIVVYVRRDDEYSVDPAGIDLDVLFQLAQEPNVCTCFVLWCPNNDDPWDSNSWRERINMLHSVDVDIKLCALRNDVEIESFLDELQMVWMEASETIKLRIEEKKKAFDSKAKGFEADAKAFVEEITHKTAALFQTNLREDIRAVASAAVERLKDKLCARSCPIRIHIPSAEFLASISDLLPPAFENVAKDDADDATGINELQCRIFMVNLLIGQTLEHAQNVAGQLYDGAFARVLDEVGNWFFMDGSVFLNELDLFCQVKENPQDQEDMLKEILSREHFIQMFMGCTLWNIMPVLYALFLPTHWEKTVPIKFADKSSSSGDTSTRANPKPQTEPTTSPKAMLENNKATLEDEATLEDLEENLCGSLEQRTSGLLELARSGRISQHIKLVDRCLADENVTVRTMAYKLHMAAPLRVEPLKKVSFDGKQFTSRGEPVPPSYWGITKGQVRKFYHEFLGVVGCERMTARTMVENLICPKYVSGRSVALEYNDESPLAIECLISHSWDENVKEFLEDLLSTPLSDTTVLFICFFCVYQGTEEEIDLQVTQGTDDIHNGCFGRILRHLSVKAEPKMFVIPNDALAHNGQGLYSRLYCTWEVYNCYLWDIAIIFWPDDKATEKHFFGGQNPALFTAENGHCGPPNKWGGKDELQIKRAVEAGAGNERSRLDCWQNVNHILAGRSFPGGENKRDKSLLDHQMMKRLEAQLHQAESLQCTSFKEQSASSVINP